MPLSKKVLIILNSSRLGDTLAWIPYCEIYRETHPYTEVFVQCGFSHLFEIAYPYLNFSNLPTIFDQTYNINWDVRYLGVPLQKVACIQLGLPYEEVRPKIACAEDKRRIGSKIVTISTQSTAQAKFWNNPKGWSTIIKYLREKGYKVLCIDQYEYYGDIKTLHINYSPNIGVISKVGPHIPLEDRILDLKQSDLFIGLGSGMSWLAWSLKVPTVLISGFSCPGIEMQEGVERVYAPDNKCRGCFCEFDFDPSNWNWCPNPNKLEEFECSKYITPESVIKKIDKIINKEN